MNKKFNNIFEHVKPVFEQDDRYSAEVKVDIYSPGGAIEADKVSIPFSLEVEYRSWGIKSIYPIFYDVIKVPFTQVDMNDRESFGELTVDLTKISIDWVAGGFYAPSALNLYVNDKGEVDYHRSNLEFMFINKE